MVSEDRSIKYRAITETVARLYLEPFLLITWKFLSKHLKTSFPWHLWFFSDCSCWGWGSLSLTSHSTAPPPMTIARSSTCGGPKPAHPFVNSPCFEHAISFLQGPRLILPICSEPCRTVIRGGFQVHRVKHLQNLETSPTNIDLPSPTDNMLQGGCNPLLLFILRSWYYA